MIAVVEGVNWMQVLVQAGPAGAVCGMFLWYLKNKQAADDKARVEFLNHMGEKDKAHAAQMTAQMAYLKSRDEQSKSIAESGHGALRQKT